MVKIAYFYIWSLLVINFSNDNPLYTVVMYILHKLAELSTVMNSLEYYRLLFWHLFAKYLYLNSINEHWVHHHQLWCHSNMESWCHRIKGWKTLLWQLSWNIKTVTYFKVEILRFQCLMYVARQWSLDLLVGVVSLKG